MSRVTYFVDLVLPLPIPNLYTYRVPVEFSEEIQVGKRVIAQFGKGTKLYTGIIVRIHEKAPDYEAKYLDAVLDEHPIVNSFQLKFWKWIESYYMANPGDVMNAALPSSLKLASETKILLHENFRDVIDDLSDNEYLIVEALEVRNELNVAEIAEILGIKNIHGYIKKLIEKKAIVVEEELKRRYKPKMESYVRLSPRANDEEQLKLIFDEISRAGKQVEALMGFIQLNQRYSKQPKAVRKVDLQKTANISPAIINALVKKEVFEIYEEEVNRIKMAEAQQDSYDLNEEQLRAFREIKSAFREGKVTLLHGVTSSGKTEVYIQLIEEALKANKQVLYLLPEIALTAQIVGRLQKVFGDKVGVYHSRYNENERAEVWNEVLKFDPTNENSRFQVILGARSAMFLPYSHLGLVIVDEEHENTFKQYDPAPRYQARDASIVLANMHKANVLLGSATPSVESYRNAKDGKFQLVEMFKRFGNVQMPEILCADIKDATKKKKMKSLFSPLLFEAMEEALENKEQIILFQNRRGYSPIMICETCGHTAECKNCDVGLTYHKYTNRLNCHYCGYSIATPKVCPACGDTAIKVKGFGTEKIEEEIGIYFPEAKVARMDLDTTRAKNAYHTIINQFENQEVQILVGTQMVTKGLDFSNVSLVGILNADNMLHFPDFRSYERSYQLMSQVSGRAGRKSKRGKVIIQSYNPDHQIIRNVIDHDYHTMFKNEVIDRRNFKYPPYYRLIRITLKHRQAPELNIAADFFARDMKAIFGNRVLGPEFPAIAKIRNSYHKQIILKVEKSASIQASKDHLMKIYTNAIHRNEFKGVRVIFDVDPY
ncbi:primosomal protein N' [bacterium]|nr:primosomal protein N' [bacterium]